MNDNKDMDKKPSKEKQEQKALLEKNNAEFFCNLTQKHKQELSQANDLLMEQVGINNALKEQNNTIKSIVIGGGTKTKKINKIKELLKV
jgi:hypothetical protein